MNDDNMLLIDDQWEMSTVRISSEEIEMYEKLVSSDEMSIKTGVSSIIGTRQYQQDTLFVNVDNNVAVGVVCDGMGGLEGGELASQKATMTFAEDFYTWVGDENHNEENIIKFLKDEAVKMDKEVAGLKKNDGSFMDAGTTAVAVVVFDNRMYWMSVGDSRIYLLRNGCISKLTRDHNVRLLIDEEFKRGIITKDEYDAKAKNAEGLISYIGMGDVELIDTNDNSNPILLEKNDIIILCSDGVYKRLPDKAIADIIWCEEPDMNRAAKRITDVVMQYTEKNQDNTTIVLMQYNNYLS